MIQSALVVYQSANFSDLMGAVIQAEMDVRRREGEFKDKCPFQIQSSQSGQKSKKPIQPGGPSKGLPTTSNYQEIVYHGKTKERKSLIFASRAWKAMKSRRSLPNNGKLDEGRH